MIIYKQAIVEIHDFGRESTNTDSATRVIRRVVLENTTGNDRFWIIRIDCSAVTGVPALEYTTGDCRWGPIVHTNNAAHTLGHIAVSTGQSTDDRIGAFSRVEVKNPALVLAINDAINFLTSVKKDLQKL